MKLTKTWFKKNNKAMAKTMAKNAAKKGHLKCGRTLVFWEAMNKST